MKIRTLFLCCLLAGGCVPARHGGSFDALGAAHAADARSLAAQTADELSARHAPAHTPLALHRAPGLFGEALEAELRSRGFALTDSGSPLGVRYTVDLVRNNGDPSLAYVQVSCTDNRFFSFTRPLGQPKSEAPKAVASESGRPHERPLPDASRALPVAAAAPRSSVPLPHSSSATSKIAPVVPPEPTHPVRETATAGVIARRNGVPVGAFCRWNRVDADAMLEKGRPVYLAEPSARPVVAEPAVLSEKTPHAPLSPSVPASPLEKPAPVAPTPRPSSPLSAPPLVAPVQTALADLSGTLAAESKNVVTSPIWEVGKGRMLRDQMADWAARADYTLVWNAQNDYELRGSATFRGEFIDAVKTFFAALQANGLALRVTIYQGNKVMEVSEH